MTGRARRRGGARWRVGEGNRRGESGVVIGRRVGEPPARAHRRRQSAPSTQVDGIEVFRVRASLTHYRARSRDLLGHTARYGHDGRSARAPFTTATTTRGAASWCRTCRRASSCLPHRPDHGIAASRARRNIVATVLVRIRDARTALALRALNWWPAPSFVR